MTEDTSLREKAKQHSRIYAVIKDAFLAGRGIGQADGASKDDIVNWNLHYLAQYEEIVAISSDLNASEAKDRRIEALEVDNAKLESDNARLRGAISEAADCLDGEPEYHDQGMGCGLEDRGITDRYDAMAHGWEKAMERVYGENIAWAKDVLSSALSGKEGQS